MSSESIEIFKDIMGYEGFYQISNFGRVKSLKRKWRKNDRILNGSINKDGYMKIGLTKENKRVEYSIHRLVALNFIHKIMDDLEVNHINNNRTDKGGNISLSLHQKCH